MKNKKILNKWKGFLVEAGIDMASFKPRNELHPKIWTDNYLNPVVRHRLIQIAEDFFDSLEVDPDLIEDVVFTGSLAAYNWSRYSDIDLHILVNFEDIEEDNRFIKDFFDAKRVGWNRTHNIKIRGFEVEIYVQDVSEVHHATGMYSLLDSTWLTKPSKLSQEINWNSVEEKTNSISKMVDGVKRLFNIGAYKSAIEFAEKIKEKIRKMRRCGLEEGGIYSPENIAFKALRRNGELQRLSSLKILSYDRMMSFGDEEMTVTVSEEQIAKNWKQYLDEDFQDDVKKKHKRLKRKNIGLGGNKFKTPKSMKKPSIRRSKSSPPGFQGT